MGRFLMACAALACLACPARDLPRDAGQFVDAGSGAGGGDAGFCSGYPPTGPTGGATFVCPFLPIRADVNFPHEQRVFGLRAPVPECRAVPLSVSVVVTAPDGTQVPLDSSATASADQFGGVWTTVAFTPPDSGTYVARASFEPSLGEASGSVSITPFFDERGVTITSATDCTDTPWPLGGTTLACETSSGIALYAADGGRFEFDGVNLVTAGDVIWSLRDAGAGYALQRHVWSGSSLALTDEWAGEFSADRIRGLHTPDMAIRLRSPLGGHQFLMVARRGASLKEAFIPDDVAVLDGGNIFWSETGVSDSSQLVAFAGVPWIVAPPNVSGRDCGFTAAVLSLRFSPSGYGYGLPSPAHPTPPPSREFEQWPLWLDISGRTVIPTKNWFSDFPLSRVVRVGSTHVLLETDGGYLLAPLE